MALTKIVKGMLADGSVQPSNLITTATYAVGTVSLNTLTVSGGAGLTVNNLRNSTSTQVAFFNASTGELTYGSLAAAGAGFDQGLNTTDRVRFASVTATNTLTTARLVVGNYTFPTTLGAANTVLVSDGAGNVTFRQVADQLVNTTSTVRFANMNITNNLNVGNATTSSFLVVSQLATMSNLTVNDQMVGNQFRANVVTATNLISTLATVTNRLVMSGDAAGAFNNPQISFIGQNISSSNYPPNNTDYRSHKILIASSNNPTTFDGWRYGIGVNHGSGPTSIYNMWFGAPPETGFAWYSGDESMIDMDGYGALRFTANNVDNRIIYSDDKLEVQSENTTTISVNDFLWKFNPNGSLTFPNGTTQTGAGFTTFNQPSTTATFGRIYAGNSTDIASGIYGGTSTTPASLRLFGPNPASTSSSRIDLTGAGIQVYGDLIPRYNLGPTLGAPSRRWKTGYISTLYVGRNTIYFEDFDEETEISSNTSTLSLSTGTIFVDSTAYVDQPLTQTSTPTFASVNATDVTFDRLTASTATFTNLTVIGTMTVLNVTTENVTTENIVTQNFADGTSQTTAWTGTVADSQITSVSTSKVNGLSVVGWTNNYNDLINKPTIPSPFDLSTVTNQALFTTSTVTFQHVRTANTLTFAGAVARMAGVRLASFVTPGVSSNILFYNTTTGETGWFPGPNQQINTSSVVTFAGVTTTNITVRGNIVFNDATTQGTTGQTSVYARNALPSGTTGRIITISDSGSDTNSPAGNYAPAYWDPDAGVWTYIGNSNSVTPI